MDETTTTTTGSSDAWALSALGQGLSVLVDRTLNNPQTIQPSTGYGVDQNGNLYKLGQPTTTQTVTPVSGGGSMQLLMLIGLVLLVANHG